MQVAGSNPATPTKSEAKDPRLSRRIEVMRWLAVAALMVSCRDNRAEPDKRPAPSRASQVSESTAHGGRHRLPAYEISLLLAELNDGSTSATRGYLTQAIVSALWMETCRQVYRARPDHIRNADVSILDAVSDRSCMYITCDFARLKTGQGALEFDESGAWVSRL